MILQCKLCMCGIETKAVLHCSRLRLHGNVSRNEETNWLKRCMGNGVKPGGGTKTAQ